MAKKARAVEEVYAAWRERHAAALSALQLHALDALAARATTSDGRLKRALTARLQTKMADAPRNKNKKSGRPPTEQPDSLRAVTQTLAFAAQQRPDAAAYPSLPAVNDFRQQWSTVRAETQLRRSEQPAPENAGPLNSGALMHRAIARMRQASPAYLQALLSYTDDLAWMELIKQTRTKPHANDGSARRNPQRPRKSAIKKTDPTANDGG